MKKIIIFFIILFFIKNVFAGNYEKFLVLRNTGKHLESLNEIESLIVSEPENYDYKLHKAIVLSWIGKYAEAEKILMNIINKYPEYYEAYVSLARIYFWQNRYNEAEQFINKLLLLKPDDTESKKVLEQIKYQKQIVYNKNIFIDNILSSRNDNKQINFINPSLGQKLDLYFSVNILRDYEPLLNKYPYKEITFKTGAGYNSFYKKNPVSIYLKKGILKQINDNTGENEYSLSINSLTLKSSYSFNKTHLTTVLNLNQNNNQGPSYFKTSNDCIRLRPFLLLNNEISENYKIYTSYSSEDWYRKSSNSNNLFIESLHTFSISNLFISKKTYYSLDMSRSVYSKDSVRNYTDYIFQADKLLTSSLKKELRLILKYKYRDYKNSNLHFYYFKTFYSFNQLNNSKIKYGCSYEFNLIKPYTTTGHKLETNLTYKLNEKINVSIETDFLFYTAKDKDRELNTFLKLDYKY